MTTSATAPHPHSAPASATITVGAGAFCQRVGTNNGLVGLCRTPSVAGPWEQGWEAPSFATLDPPDVDSILVELLKASLHRDSLFTGVQR
jgi:hypothetical protein